MDYRALTQIALIAISITLIFIYIRPTFETIGTVQDELFEVQAKVVNAEEFNRVLDDLVRVENSFSQSDRESLELFLPTTLDTAQILRDIESLFEDYEIRVGEMSAAPIVSTLGQIVVEGDEGTSGPQLAYQDFTVNVSGSYDDLKDMLSLVEANAYPLEVAQMDVRMSNAEELGLEVFEGISLLDEGQEFSFEMVLRAHALTAN